MPILGSRGFRANIFYINSRSTALGGPYVIPQYPLNLMFNLNVVLKFLYARCMKRWRLIEAFRAPDLNTVAFLARPRSEEGSGEESGAQGQGGTGSTAPTNSAKMPKRSASSSGPTGSSVAAKRAGSSTDTDMLEAISNHWGSTAPAQGRGAPARP